MLTSAGEASAAASAMKLAVRNLEEEEEEPGADSQREAGEERRDQAPAVPNPPAAAVAAATAARGTAAAARCSTGRSINRRLADTPRAAESLEPRADDQPAAARM